MKIRALTLFITDIDKDRLNYFSQRLLEIHNEKIWTKRIALPPTPQNTSLDKLVDYIPQVNDILFSIIHLKSNDPRIEQIPSILSTNSNFYASILLHKIEDARKVSEFISKLDSELATRFSVLINDDFLVTPYFPVGSANVITDSLAISVLYASDFLRGDRNKALVEGNEIGIKYSKELGVRYLGIDISLSPWLDESVGEIIEARSGKIYSPGNMYAVAELNKEIFDTAWKLKITPIGFSEVMLPVAEDAILMKRVKEESLKLTHLQQLTTVCVAGLDMVAIPRDKNLYYKIILDSFTIQFIKRRPYGIRIIPSTGSGKIFLKSYGEIPEIKTL